MPLLFLGVTFGNKCDTFAIRIFLCLLLYFYKAAFICGEGKTSLILLYPLEVILNHDLSWPL